MISPQHAPAIAYGRTDTFDCCRLDEKSFSAFTFNFSALGHVRQMAYDYIRLLRPLFQNEVCILETIDGCTFRQHAKRKRNVREALEIVVFEMHNEY